MERLATIFCANWREFTNEAKAFFLLLFSWAASILSPVGSSLYLLLGAFAANLLFGLLSIRPKSEAFSMKKFTDAFLQFALYGGCMVIIHWMGQTYDDRLIYEDGLKWFVIIVIVGYIANILKNAKIMWPTNRTVILLYDIITFTVLDKIRERFLLKKNEDDQH